MKKLLSILSSASLLLPSLALSPLVAHATTDAVPTLFTAPAPTSDDDSSTTDEANEQTDSSSNTDGEMHTNAEPMLTSAAPETSTDTTEVRTTHSEHEKKKIREHVKGRILLEVEKHGEAWYVSPVDGQRYYMKDGPTAYTMMRKFGLGISEDDFAKLEAGNSTLKNSVEGKIILRVHRHGEAYYINPADGSITYLKDGDAAYKLMREQGLGITDNDLGSLTPGTVSTN